MVLHDVIIIICRFVAGLRSARRFKDEGAVMIDLHGFNMVGGLLSCPHVSIAYNHVAFMC